jgi:hypothetical protein
LVAAILSLGRHVSDFVLGFLSNSLKGGQCGVFFWFSPGILSCPKSCRVVSVRDRHCCMGGRDACVFPGGTACRK